MVKHDQALFLIISMCSSSAKRASMSSFEKKQGRILKRIGIRVTTLGLTLKTVGFITMPTCVVSIFGCGTYDLNMPASNEQYSKHISVDV